MSKPLLLFLTFTLFGCRGIESQTLSVPNSDLKVRVEKTHAHAFLAEYDCELILVDSDGRNVDSKRMTGDTGGLARIDVMQTKDGTLVFRDHAQSVCLESRSRSFTSCVLEPTFELGYLDFGEDRKWGFTEIPRLRRCTRVMANRSGFDVLHQNLLAFSYQFSVFPDAKSTHCG